MRCLLVLALALAAPSVRAAPDASPELAALVPAETLVLFEGNDQDGRGRYGDGTAIGKLLAEPEVRRFAKNLEESLRATYAGNARAALAPFGLAPEDFDGIRLRRFGLAVVSVSLEAEQVDAVLYLDVRAGREKLERILRALRQAGEAFGGLQFKEEVVRGRTVISTERDGHEFSVASQGDRFVLTTRRARLDEVLKAMDEGHVAPLSASPRMARLRDRMGAARSAILGYADAPALVRLVLSAFRYEGAGDAGEAEQVIRALGLDALEAIGFADVPEGGGYRTEAALLLKERRGLFALAPTKPPSHRFAAMTPPDALVYGGETCDLAALWDGILALARRFDEDTASKLARGEREISAMLGVDLRKDLLEALGTEWGAYVAGPPGGGLLPDVVLFATVRDRERLARTLDALADKAREFSRRGATVATARAEYQGKEIRFLEITDKRGDPEPFAPAWCVGEDFVVFGLWPQAVKHALMAKVQAPDAVALGAVGLLGSAEFQRLLAAAPKSAVSTTYIDVGRVITWLYGTGVPFLQMAQGAVHRKAQMLGLRLNLGDLPTADVLARHLEGMLCYTAVEDDCLRFGYVSQIGAPLAVVPVAVLAGIGIVLLPRSMAAEARARDEVVREELEAQARAREAVAREEERARLRAENEMLRKRLDELEKKVAELLDEAGEGDK